MRRLMVLLLLALGWVAISPVAAYACETPAPPRTKQLRQAAAVFTGTVSQVAADPGDAGMTTLYVVRVDQVYKGKAVNSEVTVSSPTTREKCGLSGVTEGKRYLFVAGSVTKGKFQARSFQGTQTLSPEVRTDLSKVLGSGAAPADQQSVDDRDDKTVTTERVDSSAPPSAVKAIAPGLLLALLGGLVLGLARFFSRTRPT